jgi:choline kinase
MKAIVLCAGNGRRLRPLTDDRPKCLLRIGERTILDLCLDNLEAAGIHDVVLVTGYERALVERLVRERDGNRILCVVNENYASTNTAASLHLALRDMDDDFILINGDVLFEGSILLDLLSSPDPNGVAVDADIPLDAEEVKVVARNGRLLKISKELEPRQCQGEAIGIYKISRNLVSDLVRIYAELERNGEFHHYFEKGFERILEAGGDDSRAFGLSFTRGRPWAEIDTLEDYEYARREIYPRIRR